VGQSKGEVIPFLDGKPLPTAGSLSGVDPEVILLGRARDPELDAPLVRVGLAIDERGRVLDDRKVALSWLFAAGDLVAGAPRTALHAIASGALAGRGAAQS
jgi:pyruvate/2-oxoglutarate dehydrogenase complex dihydrolipoamide dehydrogenase (E3) component